MTFGIFALDKSKKWLALGNLVGEVALWDLEKQLGEESLETLELTDFGLISVEPLETLTAKKSTCTIRQIAWAHDSSCFIAINDGGQIQRWNKTSSDVEETMNEK